MFLHRLILEKHDFSGLRALVFGMSTAKFVQNMHLDYDYNLNVYVTKTRRDKRQGSNGKQGKKSSENTEEK